MKEYDSNNPLIHLHIPKTAGTSVLNIYKGWFGDGLLFHYFNESQGRMPQKYDLEYFHIRNKPVCVYGHFNRARGFGIEHYYPESDQYITILRDPFERIVSDYFYNKRHPFFSKNRQRISEIDLREHIFRGKGTMLNYFPQEVTIHNYKDMIETRFIEVGITEYLEESMKRIATKLNLRYDPESLPNLNRSERDQRVPQELREEYMAKCPLEYALYNYVLAKYT